MTTNTHTVLTNIAQVIYDKKGFNTMALDVRKISTMTEYYMISEGNVDRHVKALSNTIQDKMHELDWKLLHLEGQQDGEWIVLDYGDIVIHLLTEEMREKYALEQLWHDGKIVDLPIEVSKIEK